jgi:hypothetical protein
MGKISRPLRPPASARNPLIDTGFRYRKARPPKKARRARCREAARQTGPAWAEPVPAVPGREQAAACDAAPGGLRGSPADSGQPRIKSFAVALNLREKSGGSSQAGVMRVPPGFGLRPRSAAELPLSNARVVGSQPKRQIADSQPQSRTLARMIGRTAKVGQVCNLSGQKGKRPRQRSGLAERAASLSSSFASFGWLYRVGGLFSHRFRAATDQIIRGRSEFAGKFWAAAIR